MMQKVKVPPEELGQNIRAADDQEVVAPIGGGIVESSKAVATSAGHSDSWAHTKSYGVPRSAGTCGMAQSSGTA